MVWEPRELNVEADAASRLQDPDNWGIIVNVFNACQSKWRNFTVDRFSDHLNCLFPRFNSKYFVPGTEAVDCFGENWANDFNWIIAPVGLVVPALHFMLANQAEGVYSAYEIGRVQRFFRF